MSEALMENDGYDHSILGESQVMMIQFGVGLLLFMTYYAVFLVIDRNHPVPTFLQTLCCFFWAAPCFAALFSLFLVRA